MITEQQIAFIKQTHDSTPERECLDELLELRIALYELLGIGMYAENYGRMCRTPGEIKHDLRLRSLLPPGA